MYIFYLCKYVADYVYTTKDSIENCSLYIIYFNPFKLMTSKQWIMIVGFILHMMTFIACKSEIWCTIDNSMF